MLEILLFASIVKVSLNITEGTPHSKHAFRTHVETSRVDNNKEELCQASLIQFSALPKPMNQEKYDSI